MTITETRFEHLPIEDVHPSKANVRRAVELDAGFVQSIKGAGIIQPLVVIPNANGYEIVAGHRRHAGAKAAGLTVVPCVIRHDLEEARSVLSMLVENTQREDLSVSETLAAYEQLAAFDLTAEEIASAIGHDQSEISNAIRASKSRRARDLVAKAGSQTLTLEMAASIADFEGEPDAMKRLDRAVADGHGLQHTIQQLRDERRRWELISAEQKKLRDKKVDVFTRVNEWGDLPDGVAVLSRLYADAETMKAGKPLTVTTHKKCGGHAAYVKLERNYERGSLVVKATPVYICTEWRRHGHVASVGYGGRTAAPSAKEQRDAAKRRKDAADFRSATTVRLAFLKDVIDRTLTVEEERHIMTWLTLQVAACANCLNISTKLQTARWAFLTGTKQPTSAYDWKGVVEHVRSSPGRLGNSVLLIGACAVDTATSIDSLTSEAHRRWYELLDQLGYELAVVERPALAKKKPGDAQAEADAPGDEDEAES